MCIFKAPSPPPPPPLAPAPPPPEPPKAPLPSPDPVVKDVNPQVRRAKEERKKKSNFSQGTGSLRIKLDPKVNTGTNQTGGGLN